MSSTPSTPTIPSDTPPSSTTFSPTASPSQTNDGGGGPSSSLYLFTFLATLFLLLFVSSAIILRSFILRRRFRRRIEEAILAGVIPPPHNGRMNRRRVIGEKPKLWESRVYPAVGDRWDAIVPVTAQSIGEHGKTTTAIAGETQAAEAPLPPSPHDPSRPVHRRPWLSSLFAWRRGTSSPSNPPPTSEPFEDSPSGLQLQQQQNAPSSSHDRMRVTVLIAMPDPRRPHADGSQQKGKERSLDLDYEEDDLPEMTLGMTELQCKDTITTTKSP